MINLKNKKGKLEPSREANTDAFIRENQNLINQGVRGIKVNLTETPQTPGRRIETESIGDFIFKIEVYGSPGEANWAEVYEIKAKPDIDVNEYNNAKIKRLADNSYMLLKQKYGEAFQSSDRWEILENIIQAIEKRVVAKRAAEKSKIADAFKNINKKTQK